MPTTSRKTDLRREVIKADPEWNHTSRVVDHVYKVPQDRDFKERTATSGPYAPDDDDDA